jgi:uncharacterized protein (UPF0335 family)
MMTAAEIAEKHNASVKASGTGHNSNAHLKAFVERIEKLEDEKKAIAEDIRDVVKEAKGNGFDTKALRSIVRLRKQDPVKRAEEEAVLDTYKAAMGLLD